MVARRNDYVDPALFPGRAHKRYRGVQVLGDRSGNVSKLTGVAARTQVWRLDKTELKDVQGIQAEIAREELREEQAKGSLIDYNLFVDGNQFKNESQVKLYGTITYDEVSSLADMMLYITAQLLKENRKINKDTGDLRRSPRWVHNSADVRPGGVPILDRGDQLIVYGDVPYAKYHESGTKKGTKASWVYRKVAARARRRFGRGFIVEHAFIQNASILPMKGITRFSGGAGGATEFINRNRKGIRDDYTRVRWQQSFPAIKITQRQGVKFRVQ